MITHQKTIELYDLALMCRFMKTTPSQLRKEDPQQIKYLTYIFRKWGEKNPMSLFN